MTNKKIISLCILVLAFFMHASEAKGKPKPSLNKPPADCQVMTDSLKTLYDAGDPSYLNWDVSTQCDSSQIYTAYYYQGLGFYFLSAWKESLYFFTMAKDIAGDKDEEILFHLWNVNKKLDRYQEMERATLELHKRYPNSFFLIEILNQWKSVKKTSKTLDFEYSSGASLASNDYSDKIFKNRLSVTTGQRNGKHVFQETASLSHSTNLENGSLKGLQMNLGLGYGYKGLSADINYGAGYNPPDSTSSAFLISQGGASQTSLDSNWNFRQGRIGVGYSLTTSKGWNIGWKLDALELTKDWHALDVSHTQSFLFTNLILLAYIDYQIHEISETLNGILPSDPTSTSTLDGLQILVVNLSPYLSLNKHSFSLSSTYYLSYTHYSNSVNVTSADDPTEWDHSLTGSISYGYKMNKWIKFNFGGSYGFEFRRYNDSSKDRSDPIWSADAGFTVSY